jgi:Tfp pilus assembly protein PilE
LGYTSFPATVGGGYYTVTVTSAAAGTTTAAPTFLLTAVPVVGSDQAKDTACGSFSLNSTGVQSVSGTATDCW